MLPSRTLKEQPLYMVQPERFRQIVIHAYLHTICLVDAKNPHGNNWGCVQFGICAEWRMRADYVCSLESVHDGHHKLDRIGCSNQRMNMKLTKNDTICSIRP